MEIEMNHQEYANTYRAAMDAATDELDGLFEEAKRLRNRMEQIDSAISALRVLVGNGTDDSLAGAHAEESDADVVPIKQQFDAALGMAFA